jgi:protein-tyrosine phosphatase
VRRRVIGGSNMPLTEKEIIEWKSNGVKRVLILAENWEIEEIWGNVNYYFSKLEESNLEYLHLPVSDGYAPRIDDALAAIKWLKNGKGNLVHCVAGIGRTGSLISAYLIDTEGLNVEDAINEVRKFRPGAVQTVMQFEFLLNFEKVKRSNYWRNTL